MRPPKVKSTELTSLRMVAGNEKKYSTVVDNGVVKVWVGYGWLETRPANDHDYEIFPEVER